MTNARDTVGLLELAQRLREAAGCAGLSISVTSLEGDEETAIVVEPAMSDHDLLKVLASLQAALASQAKRLAEDIEARCKELGVCVVTADRHEESFSGFGFVDEVPYPPKAKA